MKKLLFSFFILTSIALNAQVTINPSAFDVNESITITVDLNSTDTDCNGLNSPAKVYMHSGIGDNSNAFGFNVVGNWGQDDGVGEMTSNGDGTWSITITPESYYGLNATQAENATQIGIVFRNADGSEELKANGCNDFIIPVGIVIVNIVEPTSTPVIVASGDNLVVKATMTFQGSAAFCNFEVFFNDVAVPPTNGTCGTPTFLNTIMNITQNGTVKVVGTPSGQSGTIETGESTFEVIIAPATIEQALPAGLVDGINYDEMDATKATLVIDVPSKEAVQVAGSFNSYTPTNSYTMKKDPSTNKYWLELTGLTSGQIETYQYWVYDTNPVSGSPSLVKTADPYSTLVLSPFDDSGIPSSSYPSLPTYPAGQEREVTVLQTGQTPYSWVVPNFTKPKKEDLIIYEVLIRDFNDDNNDRNFQDLINKIDYFKNLNINAIELMPVMEFEGNESWGYNTAFHMALDKFYGTKDKFKELVDVCHQNGIAVILDVALNHAFGRNPMNRMWMNDPDGDGWGDPSSENPYFNQVATHSYSVGSDFNHSQAITQNYTQRVIKHWIEEFKIDGFRWDLTKGFTQNAIGSDYNTEAYQSDRVAILKQYADYSWGLDPTHYVIFEHLGSDHDGNPGGSSEDEETEWADYGIMLWGKTTDPYNQLTMGYNSGNDISRMGHLSRGWTEKRLVGYAESHDEERLMYKNLQFGNSSNGSHDVTNLNTALQRMSALGAVSLTIPGPKMIWHFAELGMENSLFTCPNGTVNDPDCKLDTKPQPQWTNNWLSDPNRSQIYNDWARLIDLKINEAVFEGDYSITTNTLTPKIYVWDNALPNLKNVVILANFDVTTQNVTPNFPYTGNWYDLMDETGNTFINVTDTASPISIPAGEFRIYGNQGVTLGTKDVLVQNTFKLYPNPTSTAFKVNKAVEAISIYDLTGKLIAKFNGNFRANHEFDVSHISQGMYIVKFDSNSTSVSKRLIIK